MHTGDLRTWEVEVEGSEGFKAGLSYMLVSSKQTKQNQNVDKSNYLPTDKWENKLQLPLIIGHCLAIRSRSVSVIPALRRLAREIGILRPTWAT